MRQDHNEGSGAFNKTVIRAWRTSGDPLAAISMSRSDSSTNAQHSGFCRTKLKGREMEKHQFGWPRLGCQLRPRVSMCASRLRKALALVLAAAGIYGVDGLRKVAANTEENLGTALAARAAQRARCAENMVWWAAGGGGQKSSGRLFRTRLRSSRRFHGAMKNGNTFWQASFTAVSSSDPLTYFQRSCGDA